jgi:murein DD-endopeptidase MepM/ murein hydrolase activator NlpD
MGQMARRAGRFIPLLVIGLLLLVPTASGDDASRKDSIDARLGRLHEKIAAAQRQEQALSAQIADVTSQIRSLEARVGDVSTRLATLEHDLALYEEKLDRITALFRLETKRLRFLRKQYDVALERLTSRLVSIYENGEVDTIGVLFSASSFSDAVDQLEYLNDLAQQDRRIAVEVADAKEQARIARERTKKVRARVAATTRVVAFRTTQVRQVRDTLLASEHRLSSAKAQKQRSLAGARASEREAASEAAALAKVSAQLGAQIAAAQASRAASAPAAPAGSSPSASGLIWPVNGPVVSGFGMRWGRLHAGIDIAAPSGTPIHAAASGAVIYSGWMSGYGNLVVIDHGRGLATAYAHQSSIAAGNGQSVSQGQVIGYVGCTGHCFGPHLHFEVRVNGTPVDPLGYL